MDDGLNFDLPTRVAYPTERDESAAFRAPEVDAMQARFEAVDNRDERRVPAEGVVEQIDRLVQLGAERMAKADRDMRGLRPAELDWLSHEELAEYSRLITLLPPAGELRAAARERVAIKRAARLREAQS